MDISTSRLIDALGGTSEVARLIHCPISTVHSWRKNGIPQSRLAHVRLAAAAAGKGAALAEYDGVVDHVDADSADADDARGGKSDIISAPAGAHV